MRYVVVVFFAVLGCKSEHHEPTGSKKVPPTDQMVAGGDAGGIAEATLGGNPDDIPTLTFVITSVVPGQQPTTSAPWHSDGGTWTYFEAHVAGDDAARF